MNTLSKIVVFLGLAGLISCVKEVNYPVEPVIEFSQFGAYRSAADYDSVGLLTITYTDGDGDIGLYEYDTVEPYKYNYFLKFLYQKNGELIELLPADTNLGFNARIPILTPSGKNKNIKGDISIFLQLYYAWPVLESDTVCFEVYIRDRALHSSNVVRTPKFVLKRPS